MSTVSRRMLLKGAATAAVAGLSSHTGGVAAQATPEATPGALPEAAPRGFQVVFIRHAQSEANVAKAQPGVAPLADEGVTYPLTELGVEQAIARAESLATVPISAIYSSTRLRCIQTADAIAFRTKEVVRLAPEIVEVDVGPNVVGSDEETAQQILAVWQEWIAGHFDARFPSGESLNEVLARFVPFVTAGIAEHAASPETLVFVAHAITLGAALPFVFANVSQQFALENVFMNTGMARGELRDGRLVCTDWQGVPPT
jgi:broad specificity phosphatase PhoE